MRLAGGTGPYRVELLDRSGRAVASAQSAEADVTLRGATLTPGVYRLKATDSAANAVEARVTVTNEGPSLPAAYEGLPDAEVRAAVSALELAKAHPKTWAFEAEQLLASAPEEGLDRARVYQLLESYDPDEGA